MSSSGAFQNVKLSKRACKTERRQSIQLDFVVHKTLSTELTKNYQLKLLVPKQSLTQYFKNNLSRGDLHLFSPTFVKHEILTCFFLAEELLTTGVFTFILNSHCTYF